MAIIVITSRPKSLLRAIRTSIDEEHIRTWAYDDDGDFTHTAEQWRKEAWLRPRSPDGGLLKFIIVPPHGQRITKVVYAVYQGRFAEMLLAHFDDYFEEIRLTAMASYGDKV